ncbi:hypothetical protein AU488_01350 [Lonsdalea populi]|uniref:Uncharacterized protein n=3 Tax=Pectobacteriaceae TaxID=1903410 RepID=A0ACD1JA12_9GAMM|nr:hypothetical protein AU485_13460 [Lonsdalea quercina]RAT21623.1 hypothetical protein AU487_05235 [Lonsdalea populi]RAT27763.1 hypothetical protein AU488_01350 [Lonsdalea populi]RAT33377.1 hypothetical protein AU493_14875 [Lonsdalea populi]RAT34424.1 hypothetical protein AU492_08435 [Lonsdalea populi]
MTGGNGGGARLSALSGSDEIAMAVTPGRYLSVQRDNFRKESGSILILRKTPTTYSPRRRFASRFTTGRSRAQNLHRRITPMTHARYGMRLFAHAAELEKNNRAFAFIHIVECRGSTPRHSASMLVDEDGNRFGTIGGGMMERRVLEEAKEALAQGESRLFSGRMARQGDGAVGSDCGGTIKVHIAVQPRRPQLILIGAGHVNRAIAAAAEPLDFEITLVDTWRENLEHPDLPADSRKLCADSFTAGLRQLTLDGHCYVVIATNHQDKEALTQTIGKPVRYLGLLASRRKLQTFRAELKKDGVDAADLAALRSPIGLDIGAETPAEIAISVLAELLQVKNGASAASLQSTTLTVVSP